MPPLRFVEQEVYGDKIFKDDVKVEGDLLVVPVGTTAERVATQGAIRYNTTTGKFEGYTGVGWVDLH
jgi:hypothetical protein